MEMGQSMKRAFGLLCTGTAVLAAGLMSQPAKAQSDVVLGCFGGSVQQTYERYIIPSFEKKTGLRVRYIPGISTHFVSQLQAQQAKPEYDLVCMDDGPQSIAAARGVLEPITTAAVPNFADTIPGARGAGNSGVGYGLLAMGLVYSPAALKKANVEPPKGWNDLADRRFKGLIGMPSIGTTPGLFALLMLAQSNGGGVDNIDPGFAKLKAAAPNIAEFSASSEMSKQLQQGDIALSVWTNSETARFVKRTGFSLEFVYPVEGSPIVMPMLNLVKNSPNPKGGAALMDHILSADMQMALVRESRVGPVNAKVKLPPELAEGITYGDAAISKLVKPDWAAINKHRAAWTDRWNREIER
ncbi:MAG: extracellular solute-binding protein [Rhodospirillales bacterium]|nr:extracellular solute-binding protein [Rhodospirillales bacterium]